MAGPEGIAPSLFPPPLAIPDFNQWFDFDAATLTSPHHLEQSYQVFQKLVQGLQSATEQLQLNPATLVQPDFVEQLNQGVFRINLTVPLKAGEYEKDIWIEPGTEASVGLYIMNEGWLDPQVLRLLKEGARSEEILKRLSELNEPGGKISLTVSFSKPVLLKNQFLWIDAKLNKLQWMIGGRVWAHARAWGMMLAPRDITAQVSAILLGEERERLDLTLGDVVELIPRLQSEFGGEGEWVAIPSGGGCSCNKASRWVRRLAAMPDLSEASYALSLNWLANFSKLFKFPLQLEHTQAPPFIQGKGLDLAQPGTAKFNLEKLTLGGVDFYGIEAKLTWDQDGMVVNGSIAYVESENLAIEQGGFQLGGIKFSDVKISGDLSTVTGKLVVENFSLSSDIIGGPLQFDFAVQEQAGEPAIVLNNFELKLDKFSLTSGLRDLALSDVNLEKGYLRVVKNEGVWQYEFALTPSFFLEDLAFGSIFSLENTYFQCVDVLGSKEFSQNSKLEFLGCELDGQSLAQLHGSSFIKINPKLDYLDYAQVEWAEEGVRVWAANLHYWIEAMLSGLIQGHLGMGGGLETFDLHRDAGPLQIRMTGFNNWIDFNLNTPAGEIAALGRQNLSELHYHGDGTALRSVDAKKFRWDGLATVNAPKIKGLYHGILSADYFRWSEGQPSGFELYGFEVFSQGKIQAQLAKDRFNFEGRMALGQADLHGEARHKFHGTVQQMQTHGILKYVGLPLSGTFLVDFSWGEAGFGAKAASPLRYRLHSDDGGKISVRGTLYKDDLKTRINFYPGLIAKVNEVRFGPRYFTGRGRGSLGGNFIPNAWNPTSTIRIFDEQGKARIFDFICKRHGEIRLMPTLYFGDDVCKLKGR
ncbi:MAG: hypothetical protein HYU97_09220 [Deltaproteobacteria bacterium]|nr:hypothetical protein [Deltaproteobacteria bacterium]